MAIAKIEITCKECGCTFSHSKTCHNRREADSYETWAVNNITVCPDCHRKRQRAALIEKLNQHGIALPSLTGVSDKQIAYAQSTRERYLLDNINLIEKYRKVQDYLNDAEQMAQYARLCAEHYMTVEDAIRENLQAMGLDTMHTMLTSTSAREVLDIRH